MLKDEEGDKLMWRDQAWYDAEMMKMARMTLVPTQSITVIKCSHFKNDVQVAQNSRLQYPEGD